jgi:hypothetical protein
MAPQVNGLGAPTGFGFDDTPTRVTISDTYRVLYRRLGVISDTRQKKA